MALVFFSLVGIPPLSGFWPKIYLFEASFNANNYFLVGSLIFASFITLYVIAKLWSEVFWKETSKTENLPDEFKIMNTFNKTLLVLPIGILTAATLYIGLNAEFTVQLVDRISNEMLDPSPYIKAVLNN